MQEGLGSCSAFVSMYFEPVSYYEDRTEIARVQLALHKTLRNKGSKTFSTKTSRDVGMVPSVSEEHMCLHGKINWWKTLGARRGTIPCSTTKVDIIIVVHTRKDDTQHQRAYTA